MSWRRLTARPEKRGRGVEKGGMVLFLVAAVLLPVACAAVPIQKEAITFNNPAQVPLPVPARLSVQMTPGDLERKYLVQHILRSWTLEEGRIVQQAALRVFGKLFQDVFPYDGLSSAPVTARIASFLTYVNTFWGTYDATVTVGFYVGDRLLATVQGQGRHVSAMINDQVALENAYVRAFQAVGDSVLSDPRLTEALEAIRGQGAPAVVPGPLPPAPIKPGSRPPISIEQK
ncbi:MAG: hypothetical protein AB1896_10845 [Thermodesulfobacteriota bacterium]